MNVTDLELRIQSDTVVVAADGLGSEECRLDAAMLGTGLARRMEALARGIEAARDLNVLWTGAPLALAPEPTPEPEVLARGIGSELFAALFSGGCAVVLERARARSSPGRIRVVIEIDPRSREGTMLLAWPWELLFNSREEAFLGLHRETAVIRRIPVPIPVRPVPRAGRLRILAVASQPSDAAALDLDAECRALEGLDHRRGIHVTILRHQDASFEAIRTALRALRPHVLHFMGHGSFDSSTGRGVLHLTGPDGRALPLPGGDLAELLREHPSLRLVVLNACDTARQGSDATGSPFASVATAIVLRGVPNVIAMQRRIGDQAAIAFAEELYGRIEAGEPVDLAVTEARQKVQTTTGSLEWSTPALYAGDTGQLRIFRPTIRRQLAHATIVLAMSLILGATLNGMPAGTTEFDLEVQASRVRLNLARPQPIFDRLRVETVAASDLAVVSMPDGSRLEATPERRVDLMIATVRADGEARGGSLTVAPTVLPGGTRVVIETVATEDREVFPNRLRLEIDGSQAPLRIVAQGDVRTRSGLARWQRIRMSDPEVFDLSPRQGRLDLSFDLDRAGHAVLRGGIDVVGIGFERIEEFQDGTETTVEEVSTITGGRLLPWPGGPALDLGPKDRLRLEQIEARVYVLKLEPGGLSIAIRGRAAALTLQRSGFEPINLMPAWWRQLEGPWWVLLAGLVVLALILVSVCLRVRLWNISPNTFWPRRLFVR